MPVKKGRLKPADYEALLTNMSYIKEDVEARDIIHLLFEKKVFNLSDVKEIDNIHRPDGRAETMCYMLLRSGPYEAYSTFLEILRDQYPDVAEKLESTQVQTPVEASAPTPRNPWDWFDALPDQIKDQIVDDQLASRISSCLGEGWDHVFLRLGLTNVSISHARDRHPRSNSLAITGLLVAWRQKKTSGATVRTLVSVLREVSDCEVDYDGLEVIIKPQGVVETSV